MIPPLLMMLALYADVPKTVLGPYHASFIAGGVGIPHTLPRDSAVFRQRAPFTLSLWAKGTSEGPAPVLLGSIGKASQSQARQLGFEDSRPFLDLAGVRIVSPSAISLEGGVFLAATYDGTTARLFVNGREVASKATGVPVEPPPPPETHWDKPSDVLGRVDVAPSLPDASDNQHFAGRIADFTLWDVALTPATIQALSVHKPEWDQLTYDRADKPWPVQVRQQAGNRGPQDPSTLPVSRAAFPKPTMKPPYRGPDLVPDGLGGLRIAGGWRLAPAADIHTDGASVSRLDYRLSKPWLAATVPGTILTTLVDRGVYPNPTFGLNNMAIPESLAREDWWYRTEFTLSSVQARQRQELTFNGINYVAEVWLNGSKLGEIKGAFIRGVFDVTGKVRPGERNVLAVRISPPSHPGIPNEESVKGGSGANGGLQMLDGPTFVASEGWDWIPGVRDRNAGLWQDVVLRGSGPVRLVDPQVVTTLPLPARDRADVAIAVTVQNDTATPASVLLGAAFDDIRAVRSLVAAPGRTVVHLTPSDFPQLRIRNPRLWWPNGYGEPTLHELKLTLQANGTESDSRRLRFGIRELSYELSAFDDAGKLRRVEIAPAEANGMVLIDGDHDHIHETQRAWAVSLHPGAESKPGLSFLPADPLSPFLVVKVNGVRIAIKGGAWGMDDMMKRVDRARLEPFFRLNREAHMNLARNWVGQDTEESFYELADEYGLLVWNDFWESTQDYNIETPNPGLFMENAADVIARFRNHPSILIWCGRNEGVPQPYLNEGLAELVRRLDGTRYYTGSSNKVNLEISGPYNWREPAGYFTDYSRGFAVEVGTPSFSTLESFKASMMPADQWPLSDAWAYHDWHLDGNGNARVFMDAMGARFGQANDLPTFERQAQLLNYESHRAIFEGFNAGLWRTNSARILWMTQPAWPSNMWQIYSSDYDTHAAYYGVKAAAEPLHIQLNASDDRIAVVNATPIAKGFLHWRARAWNLANLPVLDQSGQLNVAANGVFDGPILPLSSALARGPLIVRLELMNGDSSVVSSNNYWRAAKPADLRALDALPPAPLNVSAVRLPGTSGGDIVIRARVTNPGRVVSLSTKLTLLDEQGDRVLPVFYADNYLTLLPGEEREIDIRVPAGQRGRASKLSVRGWNSVAQSVRVASIH